MRDLWFRRCNSGRSGIRDQRRPAGRLFLSPKLRKRKMPRVRSARPWVRARFDAVEMPLNKIKKSKNARMWALLFDGKVWGRVSGKCKLLYTLVRACVQLLDSLTLFTVAKLYSVRCCTRLRHPLRVLRTRHRGGRSSGDDHAGEVRLMGAGSCVQCPAASTTWA